ncbi:hypothetical protein NLO413_0884 [Candidatus Neoehrlichia lotoris str. RAC413]|uniref:Uncharacterized protein n=1 Tax=Candidatus Neoehrlichia procyonis str. RAC413 TaxID=1359163 RepID=A0A0F3NNZ4_9RICK|nr:hypothetical protein NLO413_0884 [Candidatus Neoehrlichia lotoris str. RAC413]
MFINNDYIVFIEYNRSYLYCIILAGDILTIDLMRNLL